jgi:dinuclear metal center YbgI/SA1388 family protein
VPVARRDEIVAYANTLLEVERWPEFAPPGLQVVGADEVTVLVCGVSSSRALFERAAAEAAEMVLVHHGLFWRNEPLVVDRRQRGRLEALFSANASLLAYHLALDAHPTLGNAAQLAARIGASPAGPFGSVGLACTLGGLSIDELTARVTIAVDREPLVFAQGPERIERLAVSTGAAGYDLIRAAHEGFDALLTGEAEEPNLATAEELGIHLIAAGHHATERFGVQALAAHLAETFSIEWRYLEVENPV